jgi:hypothetical protein
MYVSTMGLGAITWKGDSPDASVRSMQSWINVVLRTHGCHSIGEDGKVGPETCGAGLYAVSGWPAEVAVDDAARNTLNQVLGVCQQYSYSCKATATRPATTSSPSQVTAEDLDLTPSRRISTSNMVMIGTGLAAVAVVGYAIAKKKGLIK